MPDEYTTGLFYYINETDANCLQCYVTLGHDRSRVQIPVLAEQYYHWALERGP